MLKMKNFIIFMLGKENSNSENRYCNSATIINSFYVET